MRIFISYRRADTKAYARSLHERLAATFGDDNVYLDISDIPAGAPFPKHISQAIVQTDVLLVLIGLNWATVTDDAGHPRLFAEDDYVRREVELALQLDKHIIPVLVDNAPMPTADQLPASIRELPDRNAERLRNDDFDNDVQSIENTVLKLQQPKPTDKSAGCMGQVLKRLPAMFAVIATLLGLLLAFLALYPEPERNSLLVSVGLLQPTATPTPTIIPSATPMQIPTATPQPSATPTITPTPMPDLAANVRTQARTCPLDVREPQGLQVVTTADAIQIWGYSAVDRTLFVTDAACDDPQTVTLPDDIGEIAPSALHYDGDLLWLGDTGRVLALDPTTRETPLIIQLPDSDATPTNITSTEGLLWVGLRDAAQLLAYEYDAASSESHCAPIALPGDLKALAIEGQTRLWVAYGRGDAGTLQAYDPLTCDTTGDPLALDAEVFAMAFDGSALWLSAGRELVRVDATTQALERTGITAVDQMLLTNDALWLADTQSNRVRRYLIDDDAIDLDFIQADTPTDMLQNGAQTWMAQADGSLVQYLVPDFIHVGIVDMVWRQDTLWFVDEERNLCSYRAATLTCERLAIDALPTQLALASAPNTLWLATDDDVLWALNTQDASVEQFATLPGPAAALVEETNQRIWAAGDPFAPYLAAVSLDDGSVTEFNRLTGVPQFIAFDGASLWFAEATRYYRVRYDGANTRIAQEGDAVSVVSSAFAANRGGIFNVQGGELIQRNRIHGTVAERISVGSSIIALALGSDGIAWLADANSGFVYRIMRRNS